MSSAIAAEEDGVSPCSASLDPPANVVAIQCDTGAPATHRPCTFKVRSAMQPQSPMRRRQRRVRRMRSSARGARQTTTAYPTRVAKPGARRRCCVLLTADPAVGQRPCSSSSSSQLQKYLANRSRHQRADRLLIRIAMLAAAVCLAPIFTETSGPTRHNRQHTTQNRTTNQGPATTQTAGQSHPARRFAPSALCACGGGAALSCASDGIERLGAEPRKAFVIMFVMLPEGSCRGCIL